MYIGFEFTKRLRKHEAELRKISPSDHHQLVIVCSANSDVESSNLSYEAGCDAFLEKPLRMDLFNKTYTQLKNVHINEGKSH